MRYLAVLTSVLVLAAFPLSASAQAEEVSASPAPNAEKPVQSKEPTRSRLERWHPEAFVDPSKPKPTTTPVYVDPVTGAPLAVPESSPGPQTPTTPLTEQQQRIGVDPVSWTLAVFGHLASNAVSSCVPEIAVAGDRDDCTTR